MGVGVGVGRITIIREMMDSMTSTLSSENINGKELKVFKVLILGDSGTGKTALVRRSVHDFFTEGYRSTIGVDFSLKVLRWSEDLEIRLQMWDLAGQDRFNHLSRLYFNKASGALLVCDQGTEKSLWVPLRPGMPFHLPKSILMSKITNPILTKVMIVM